MDGKEKDQDVGDDVESADGNEAADLVGSYVAANGRQMRKTCRILPTVHSSTNAMTKLVLFLSPRSTNMRR